MIWSTVNVTWRLVSKMTFLHYMCGRPLIALVNHYFNGVLQWFECWPDCMFVRLLVIWNRYLVNAWFAWLSGRTSVSNQRFFAVLRSTCSWRVTTYVGKPSAIGQPTRPTQPFIFSGSINEWWAAIRCSPPHSMEAPSGERLRGKGRHGVLCRLKAVWSMPECFRVVNTMQGSLQVLCFTFVEYLQWNIFRQ